MAEHRGLATIMPLKIPDSEESSRQDCHATACLPSSASLEREISPSVFTGNMAFSLNLFLHTPVEVLPLAFMVLELKSSHFSHCKAADAGE